MGQLVSGFIEETSSKHASAQMVGWDILDYAWADRFKPDFIPRSNDFELTPSTIARLPLLGARGFPFAPNPDISNVIRLEVPRLDLPIWRQRAAIAGTARVSEFLWSDNNSLLGPVPEERLVSVSEAGSPRLADPPRSSAGHQQRSRDHVRSPPRNNRHLQGPKPHSHPPRWEDSFSLLNRPESLHRSRREIEYFDMSRSSNDLVRGPPFFSLKPLSFLRIFISPYM